MFLNEKDTCGRRCATNADYRLQSCRLQICRPADLQTCGECRLADLYTSRFEDLLTCILVDFRIFENVTEFTADSVLALLIPWSAADSLTCVINR